MMNKSSPMTHAQQGFTIPDYSIVKIQSQWREPYVRDLAPQVCRFDHDSGTIQTSGTPQGRHLSATKLAD